MRGISWQFFKNDTKLRTTRIFVFQMLKSHYRSGHSIEYCSNTAKNISCFVVDPSLMVEVKCIL